MTLPFGKFKGREVEDVAEVEVSYLKWMESQDWIDDNLREEIQFHIARVEGDRPGQGRVVRRGR